MSVKAHEELKGLQTQRDKLKATIKGLRGQSTDLNTEINQKNQKLKNIEKKINEIENSNSEIVITEHARLRYIERVIGINLEELDAKIIDEATKDIVKKMGSGTYPVGGHQIVVKKNTIVTVK